MRIKALTLRILKQLKNDKRTVLLVVFAPILILTLVYYILCDDSNSYNIGVIDAPNEFVDNLKLNEDFDINVKKLNEEDLDKFIDKEEIIAAVKVSDDFKDIEIYVDGTNSMDANKSISIIKNTATKTIQDNLEMDIEKIKESIKVVNLDNLSIDEPNFETNYIYGNEKLSFFDNYAAGLIGIIVFFFVYLLSGINFLSERTSGTLEKLLSTPIKTGEIIIGYVLSFSVLALIQTLLITVFTVYVLGVANIGNIFYIFLVNLITAISALTLGILLSTLANGEFQFVQFIPIVLLPQIFLCGMFKLNGVFKIICKFTPLYYTTDALKNIMLKGNGLDCIYNDLFVLLGFCVIFVALNINVLKRYR